MPPIKLSVLGAGSPAKGLCSNLTSMTHRVQVPAVVEPRRLQRARFAAGHAHLDGSVVELPAFLNSCGITPSWPHHTP